MEVNGSHVVVTGSSRGIGAAMARDLAGKGANVTLVARSADAINSLADELGGQAVPADLLNRQQVDELIPKIEAEIGDIDILINNAGLETTSFFHEVSAQEIRDLNVLNLESPMVLTRAVLPGMLERNRGHLVFTSSLVGTGGFPGLAVYCATKAGLPNFVAALRMELKDTNIGSTVVAPGPVDTQMWDNIEGSSDFDAMFKRLNQLKLMPQKSPEFVAQRTSAAIASNKRHVRTPRRSISNGLLREVPTRLNELALKGVAHGPQPKK